MTKAVKFKKSPGKVLNVKPALASILVEHITSQELSGTILVPDDSYIGTPQAYVLAIGPALDQSKIGFTVGDRVILQGNYVPVPRPEGQTRDVGIVEVHNIKAVLED